MTDFPLSSSLTFSSTNNNSTGIESAVSRSQFNDVRTAGFSSGLEEQQRNIAAMPVLGRNPLHQFQTYNCLFTLAALSKDLQNSGNISRENVTNIISRSQGDWANFEKRVPTDFGTFDYFIDDVIIASLPSLHVATGNSFATKITFKVTEPYSMGLFLLAMNNAASLSGYGLNFREAPYLFMIEFAGYIDNVASPEPIPELTRFIPIKMIDVKFKVTNAGCVYECEAVPYNEYAFRDHITRVTKSIGISGSTVKQLLADGETSLVSMLRDQHIKELGLKNVETTDQYIIEFPEDFTASSGSENIISRGTLYTGLDAAGLTPFPNGQDVFDEANQIIKNSSLTISPEKVWNFRQNTKIPDIITEVILRSDYITGQFANGALQTDERGMIKWFRIETRLEDGTDNEQYGRQNRKIIYRVVPYDVHVGKMLPPGVKPPGYGSLQRSVIRAYDYIYTGKNVDIINLEINFDMAFFTAIPSDTSERVGQNNRGQGGLTSGTKDPSYKLPTDTIVAPKFGEFVNTVFSTAMPFTHYKADGGAGSDGPETSQARTLQSLLTNPADMLEINMEILGDPYYLPSSGMGNQILQPVDYNLMEDGSMNYQGGEVDIVVNFRTPVDIQPTTGLYSFAQTGTAQIDQFSGLYKILEVESRFNGNKFTQILKAIRRRAQLEGSSNRSIFITQE